MIWLAVWFAASILLAPIAGWFFFKRGGGCSQLPSDEAPQLGRLPRRSPIPHRDLELQLMAVSYITCATKGCGYSPFPMDEGFEKRARNTHETFYCPAGHRLHFGGESSKEQEHRVKVETLNSQIVRWKHHYEREFAEARRCPWPTCRDYVYSSRASMFDHMRRIHDMPLLAAVKVAS